MAGASLGSGSRLADWRLPPVPTVRTPASSFEASCAPRGPVVRNANGVKLKDAPDKINVERKVQRQAPSASAILDLPVGRRCTDTSLRGIKRLPTTGFNRPCLPHKSIMFCQQTDCLEEFFNILLPRRLFRLLLKRVHDFAVILDSFVVCVEQLRC